MVPYCSVYGTTTGRPRRPYLGKDTDPYSHWHDTRTRGCTGVLTHFEASQHTKPYSPPPKISPLPREAKAPPPSTHLSKKAIDNLPQE